MLTRSAQRALENTYSYSELRNEVQAYLETSTEFVSEVKRCTEAMKGWLALNHSSPEKNIRLQQIDPVLMEQIVWQAVIHIILEAQQPQIFINVCFPLVRLLGFDTRIDAIKTSFEIVGCLSRLTNIFSVYKLSRQGSLRIHAHVAVTKELHDRAIEKAHLPPILSEPNTVKSNRDSAYITKASSVFNGSYLNHSDKEASLDALNLINSVKYSIDEEFVDAFIEEDSWDITELKNYAYLSKAEKEDMQIMQSRNFAKYMYNSLFTTRLVIMNGNEFHLNHKYDKRGRIYTDSYYINPQGNDYKKAMLHSAYSCVVELPPEFKI